MNGMELLLVPLLGPFHLLSPAWNAVSVRDAVAAWAPDALATTALAPGDLADVGWQDTAELALPLAVVPWARQRGLPLHEVGEPSPDPTAEADARRYLEPYPQARRALAEVDALQAPLAELLERPVTLAVIEGELLPLLRRHQEAREAAFGDGPLSDWLRSRLRASARRIANIDAPRLALLAPLDHLPFLLDALRQLGLTPEWASAPAPTPAARERALLDYAFRVEVPEPGRLIAQLREIAGPEARYHEANLLLAGGHEAEALDLLERQSRGDFQRPYYLPGYLLARLGQLRDLAGRREAALRAYRAVLALDYAPAEAIEAARQGLAAAEPG